MAVAEERAREVQGRREIRTPDPCQLGVAETVLAGGGADDRNGERALERRQVSGPEPVEPGPVCLAATQMDVLAVVEVKALPGEGPGRTTEPRAPLEERYRRPAVGAFDSGRQAGETATDDDDARGSPGGGHALAPARLRAATQAFSQVGRETRRTRTASGSGLDPREQATVDAGHRRHAGAAAVIQQAEQPEAVSIELPGPPGFEADQVAERRDRPGGVVAAPEALEVVCGQVDAAHHRAVLDDVSKDIG